MQFKRVKIEPDAMNKPATMVEVAKLADVSTSTVSRVLNDSCRVNAEKTLRVKKAIELLNYKPNLAAKALVGSHTNLVAIMVPNVSNNALANIIAATSTELRKYGFSTILFNFSENAQVERELFKELGKQMVDAAIFFATTISDEELIALNRKLPVLTLEKKIASTEIDGISLDEIDAFRKIIRPLIEAGHKKISYIGGKMGTSSDTARFAAWQQVMGENGLSWTKHSHVHFGWSIKDGYQSMLELYKVYPEMTAVMCCSDSCSMGALSAAYALGLTIPTDLSVTGFDNYLDGGYSIPPLTTLDYPADKMGISAANLILERLQGRKEAKHIILSLDLMPRNSIGKPRSKVEGVVQHES
ncbi:MAG: LacI family DNA-binding transcriptional regulator [Clostridia bacterium]